MDYPLAWSAETSRTHDMPPRRTEDVFLQSDRLQYIVHGNT